MTVEPERRNPPIPEEKARQRLRAELETGDLRVDYEAAVAEMSAFELQYGLSSESFYERYQAGSLQPSEDFRRWAVCYEMYRDLHLDLEADILVAMGRADQSLTE